MGDLGSTSALYSARPALSLDGQDNAGLADRLLTLLVEETTEGLYRCEAVFGNWGTANGGVGFMYFDRQVLDFGKTLAVRIGEGEAAAQVFEGRLMALEAHYPQSRPPEIVALAEDRFQDLRMTRRTRTFDEASDSDVIQQVASQHGLSADVDVSGPTHRVLAQVNQSDLAFLRGRARAIDAELWVEGDTLHAQARGRREAGQVTLTYGQGLLECSVLADLATQCSSLTVSGWDVAAKEAIEYEAAEAAIRAELNGFQSGGGLLARALGQRAESIVHAAPHTLEEAQVLAEAHYRNRARRFVTGRAVAEGDGRIRVGSHVEMQGLGALFNGEYYVTQVKHTFSAQHGFRTTFSIERPGLGSA